MADQLHLGWLKEALPAQVAVNLKPAELAAHTAIIAQSGSGKSFMLGRLLEEIARKTRARILILDPNSDFVQFGAVDPSAWSKPKGHFASDDTLDTFREHWEKIGFRIVTQRDSRTPIAFSWANIPDSDRASAPSRLNFGIVWTGVFWESPRQQGGSHEEEVYRATHG